jgi:hypothetical protein
MIKEAGHFGARLRACSRLGKRGGQGRSARACGARAQIGGGGRLLEVGVEGEAAVARQREAGGDLEEGALVRGGAARALRALHPLHFLRDHGLVAAGRALKLCLRRRGGAARVRGGLGNGGGGGSELVRVCGEEGLVFALA